MENMKIVLMNGGWGNQLYQYAFVRLLETATKESCIIDDSFFWREEKQHNGYELEKIFGLKLNLLSNCFSEDVWAEMMRRKAQGIGIPQQLLENGINLTMMQEFVDHEPFDGNIVTMPANVASLEVLRIYANTKGNFYYHGYWVRQEIVNFVRKKLLEELKFPELASLPGLFSVNLQYAAQIQQLDSVAVHVRRGDFI